MAAEGGRRRRRRIVVVDSGAVLQSALFFALDLVPVGHHADDAHSRWGREAGKEGNGVKFHCGQRGLHTLASTVKSIQDEQQEEEEEEVMVKEGE